MARASPPSLCASLREQSKNEVFFRVSMGAALELVALEPPVAALAPELPGVELAALEPESPLPPPMALAPAA